MNLLAAWLGNPTEYWPNILGLIVLVAVGVLILRKIRSKRKAQK